ncbi:mavicyanin-like [Cornus florida]|uniref:mavicyanin-like n=1 Tax=Cornus florida TaxID=4283 RepID=UPI002898626D|nr:mavicyanin-like [Cornus florida]
MVFTLLGRSYALQHIVGDSAWSIPSTPHFYTNWSSSHSFCVGDTLLFDFESELHNVMQVSAREYESCTADYAFRTFTSGPATVPLIEKGVFYFVCSFSNYCTLGQKVTITVSKWSPGSAPTSPPSPPSVPFSGSLGPDGSQPSEDDVAYSSKAPDSVDLSMSVAPKRMVGVFDNGVLFGWPNVLWFVLVLVFEWLF